MSDLRISYGELESTTGMLGGLITDLENIQASESAYDGAMGSSDISGAMDNFAGNWSVHRKKLLGQMDGLHSMVDAALTQFPATDRKTASWLPKNY